MTEKIDVGRRRFLVIVTSILGACAAALAAIPFISSWFPTARAKAQGGPVEIDISRMEPGEMMTAEWRGKPVWVIRRTDAMLQELKKHNQILRDPDSVVNQQPEYAENNLRSIKDHYLVLIGICTHLGCVPKYIPTSGELGPNWPGGFFCPCHGSKFDLAGRVFKGVPAPINLEVPPYHFINDKIIIVGEHPSNA